MHKLWSINTKIENIREERCHIWHPARKQAQQWPLPRKTLGLTLGCGRILRCGGMCEKAFYVTHQSIFKAHGASSKKNRQIKNFFAYFPMQKCNKNIRIPTYSFQNLALFFHVSRPLDKKSPWGTGVLLREIS
jgi:hypothetical protein